jgi:hypothetical protein
MSGIPETEEASKTSTWQFTDTSDDNDRKISLTRGKPKQSVDVTKRDEIALQNSLCKLAARNCTRFASEWNIAARQVQAIGFRKGDMPRNNCVRG